MHWAGICAGVRDTGRFGMRCCSLGTAPEGRFREDSQQPVPRCMPLATNRTRGAFRDRSRLTKPCDWAAEAEGAVFVSGNTDLGVVTNLRGERFTHLISLEAVPELREFLDDADAVEIGAGLRLTEIGELWCDAPAVFREWLPLFASVLIRNRATLGGNLATASPIGDAAPLLLALEARGTNRVAGGRADRPACGFFQGYRKTVLERGEDSAIGHHPETASRKRRVFTKWPSAAWTTSVPWPLLWR